MTLDEIFSPGGPLEKNIADYSFRSSQLEIANLAEKAFSEGKASVIEAGTGTGKSFAYLVPAINLIESDGKTRVVVATSTIALSKQLYEKDIPLLKKALGFSFESAILHGRANYLCIRKLMEKEEENSLIKSQDEELEEIIDWAGKTESGELEELKGRNRYISEVRSDAKTCISRHCPYVESCFYFKARKNLSKANLIVTNHHMFLIDGKHRMETDAGYDEDSILPSFSVAILDEAHHLEREATELLSSTFDPEEVRGDIDFLTFKKKGDDKSGLSMLEELSPYAKEKDLVGSAIHRLLELKKKIASFSEYTTTLFPSVKEILMTRELHEKFHSYFEHTKKFSEEIVESAMASLLPFDPEEIPEEKTGAYELVEKCATRIAECGSTLSRVSTFDDYDASICHMRKEGGRFVFHISPMNPGKALSSLIYSKLHSILFSSATISLGGSFKLFEERIGLEEDGVLEYQAPSPFDYERNLMLLAPQDGVQFNRNNEKGYNEYAANLIKSAIEASGGGALVLFTSWQMLEDVTERVRKMLPDMRILKQGEMKGRSAIFREFKKDKDSSLFATSTFWEGVDAPGDTLRLLIIAKLPFTPPDSPIMKARSDYLERMNENPFLKITVPEAAIKLKQGIGRLIRKEEDKGVVLILDSRIVRKSSYGEFLIRSLPKCYMPDDTTVENIPRKIEDFLY